MSNLIRDILEQHWISVQNAIQDAVDSGIIRGKGRGRLRRQLEMSPERLRVLANEKLEETLERTIVASMPTSSWFNQFNPASGIGRANASRKAADLVRVGALDGGLVMDFFELKEWHNSHNDPVSAALEAFDYAAWWLHLYQRAIPPYDSWRRVPRADPKVRIWLLAPYDYFGQYGSPDAVSTRLAELEQAVQSMTAKPGFADLRHLEFSVRPVILDRSVTRRAFVQFFDPEKIKKCVASGGAAKDPLELVSQDQVERVRTWVRQAFKQVGLS